MPEILEDIVFQHVEEAAFLWSQRSSLLRAPDVALRFLETHDERLSAHLEGIAAADEGGWRLCQMQLESGSAAAMFAAATIALEARRTERLDELIACAFAVREMEVGLSGAFEWVSAEYLRKIVKTLLGSPQSLLRCLGIDACARHGVDPGLAAGPWLRDSSPEVRCRAYRAAADLGCVEVLRWCAQATREENTDPRLSASTAAVLLGDRAAALKTLILAALAPGTLQMDALTLALQAMNVRSAHTFLQNIPKDSGRSESLIRGSGIAGDPSYVPWLIAHMRTPETARLAGEAFSLITGTDLAALNLDRPQPEDFQSGPTDDPDDENVEMDPDEGLPWPDPQKIEKWWADNRHRFQPGQRYFVGAPVTRAHCIAVLKNGYQRQRILAAHYLCLLEPGTPLFNTSAPAWRQQRLLARM